MQRAVALGVLVVAAAGVALGARFVTAAEREQAAPAVTDADKQTSKAAPKAPELRPLPVEMRGVHVTMALMSIPGKIEEYMALTKYGLNTLQIDVKDENGEVAFKSPYAPLATRIG